MEGFEPPHGGTKNRCLTAWRHPRIPHQYTSRHDILSIHLIYLQLLFHTTSSEKTCLCPCLCPCPKKNLPLTLPDILKNATKKCKKSGKGKGGARASFFWQRQVFYEKKHWDKRSHHTLCHRRCFAGIECMVSQLGVAFVCFIHFL